MSRRFQLRALLPFQWQRELERRKVPEAMLLAGVALALWCGIETGPRKFIIGAIGFVIGLCGILLLRRP